MWKEEEMLHDLDAYLWYTKTMKELEAPPWWTCLWKPVGLRAPLRVFLAEFLPLESREFVRTCERVCWFSLGVFGCKWRETKADCGFEVTSSEWREHKESRGMHMGNGDSHGVAWNTRKRRGVKGVMMMPIILGGRERCSVMWGWWGSALWNERKGKVCMKEWRELCGGGGTVGS